MSKAKIVLSASDQTKAAFDSARQNLSSLGTKALAVGATVATLGVGIAAAFAAISFKHGAQTLDQLDDLAEKTGIATESLSVLRYAGEVVGTPLEAIAQGAKKLATNMAEASAGNKNAMAIFRAMGIEVTNADGTLRALDPVLLDMADRFSKYSNGAEKSALASKVFGERVGEEMIPLLNQGAAGIRQLRGEAESLGVVYGGDLAKSSADFNDNLVKLRMNAEGAAVSIFGKTGLLAALNGLIEGYLKIREIGALDLVLKDAARGMIGMNRLTGNHAADIQSITKERDELQAQLDNDKRRGFKQQLQDDLRGRINELDRYLELVRTKQNAIIQRGADAAEKGYWGSGNTPAPVVRDDSAQSSAARAAAAKAAAEAARRLEEEAKVLADLSGLTATYAKDLELLNSMRAQGKLTAEQYAQAQANLVAQQPVIRDLHTAAAASIKAQNEEEKALAEIREKTGALADRSIAALITQNDELLRHVKTLGEEYEEIGLNTEQLGKLTLARMDATIAQREAALESDKNIPGKELENALLADQIKLLKEERAVRAGIINRTASAETDKKNKEESEEFTKTLHNDLKGALQRAFEESKNHMRAFGDALASTIYSRVTSALAEAVATPITAPLEAMLKGMSIGGTRASPSTTSTPSAFSSLLSMFGIPFFGKGGDHAGGLRVVGDRGPELEATGRSRIFNARDTQRILGGAGAAKPLQVTIVNHNTIGDVASTALVDKALRASERRTLAAFQRAKNYGGDV